MLWIGNATLALTIGCMEITFRANLRPAWNPGTAFFATIGSYLAVVLVWSGVLLYRFRLPNETDLSSL
jgi:tryptophan-rich sensory protein